MCVCVCVCVCVWEAHGFVLIEMWWVMAWSHAALLPSSLSSGRREKKEMDGGNMAAAE